jgi:methyl-accepting chemotaxis protein
LTNFAPKKFPNFGPISRNYEVNISPPYQENLTCLYASRSLKWGMERTRLSRIIGIFYVLGALLGLIIAVGGLLVLWTTRPDVVLAVDETVQLTRRTLNATSQTVSVANHSLDQASQNLVLMKNLLEGVGEALDESTGLISSTGQMIGSDLAGVINEAQDSLTEVEDSARMVDDALRLVDTTLGLLSRIPLIGPVYRPRVTLQESVVSVSRSLDPLPASFARIRRELDTSAANVAVIRAEVMLLAHEVGQIEDSLENARTVTTEYGLILSDLSTHLDRLEQRLPTVTDTLYIAITLLFASMLVTHLALLIHGIAMVV